MSVQHYREVQKGLTVITDPNTSFYLGVLETFRPVTFYSVDRWFAARTLIADI